jgi:hypothetical protein
MHLYACLVFWKALINLPRLFQPTHLWKTGVDDLHYDVH